MLTFKRSMGGGEISIILNQNTQLYVEQSGDDNKGVVLNYNSKMIHLDDSYDYHAVIKKIEAEEAKRYG